MKPRLIEKEGVKMEFQYNGNLYEDERINLVAKEITNKYPFISIDKAKAAASLEGKIDIEKTPSLELNRLYNIMFVNSSNKDIVKTIYQDYLNILNDIVDDNKYYYISQAINEYLYDFSEFPIISEF